MHGLVIASRLSILTRIPVVAVSFPNQECGYQASHQERGCGYRQPHYDPRTQHVVVIS